MTPFDRSYTSSYSHFIVTMAISCIVFEIEQDTSRQSRFFNTPHTFDAPVKVGRNFWHHGLQMPTLQRDAKILTKSSTL